MVKLPFEISRGILVVERLVANEKVEVQVPLPAPNKLDQLIIMTDLAIKNVPCEGGIPAFDIDEIHKYLKKIDGWDVLKDSNDNFYIEKSLNLKTMFKVNNLLLK